MKVKKVSIKDFKVLKNIEKEINGNNIILLGDNGRGKSSFIQFIEIALGKQTTIPDIQHGEGTIWVDKAGQEWTFHVEWKKGKPLVTVTSPDGFKDNRKSVLANVVGAMDFDIDTFVEMSESTAGRKEQVKVYKSFLPQEVQDFVADQEYRVKRSYDERTEKNREVKALQGAIAEHPFTKVLDMPTVVVNIQSITAQIESSMEHNKKVLGAKERFDSRKREIDAIAEQIRDLVGKRQHLMDMNVEAEGWLKQNDEQDVAGLMALKDKAFEINANFEKKADYEKQVAMMQALSEESGELTAFIESSNQAIADAIRDCDSPVDGLTFDADSLIYNGVPVSNASLSSSEIMHLGIKLKMAENPDLGILFIQRGESLGAQRLKDIQDLAKKYDWQIIMEQVERGNEKLTIEIMKA
jgi:energy-coupling factor transporter ATP-binding protein EcfA2